MEFTNCKTATIVFKTIGSPAGVASEHPAKIYIDNVLKQSVSDTGTYTFDISNAQKIKIESTPAWGTLVGTLTLV